MLRLVCAFSLVLACAVGADAAVAGPTTVVEFGGGLGSGGFLISIAPGQGGTMWFTDDGSIPAIGKITPTGTITEYSTGLNPGSEPGRHDRRGQWHHVVHRRGQHEAGDRGGHSVGHDHRIQRRLEPWQPAVGDQYAGDGDLWFTDIGGNLVGTSAIGKVTPAGVITEYTAGLKFCGGLPGVAGTTAPGPEYLAAGAGGKNIWFTDTGSPAIGKVTPSGAITEYCTSQNADSPAEIADAPFSITVGPNGDAWFTEAGQAIGKITPGGEITRYRPGLNRGSRPDAITLGNDGNFWFTDEGDPGAIGKVTPTGNIHEYRSGLHPRSSPGGIVPGPGGMWFTDQNQAAIGLITPSGAIHEYGVSGSPSSIARGAGDTMWFTDGAAIGRVTMR